jgi:hypothetical protein
VAIFRRILVPQKTYDIVLSSPFSNYDFFAHKMRELCGQMDLTFFLADDVWVHEFLGKLRARDVGVRAMLDLTANQTDPTDVYTQLAYQVKEQGGVVIDDPELTAFSAHKAKLHDLLVQHQVPVPETVIVPRDRVSDFRITRDIRNRVGVPFVVKPAWGDSGVGVIVDATSEYDLQMSLAQAPKSDAFLIQKQLNMQPLGERMGWFRLYHICREVIPCWWNPETHEYQMVSPAQIKRYHLQPLRRIMRKIAQVSRMKKFSSEICLHEDGKFYAVDYVNADPDMNPKSFYANGVPDEIVRHIVWLLFYEAMQVAKRGHGFFDDELEASEASENWLERRRVEQAALLVH